MSASSRHSEASSSRRTLRLDTASPYSRPPEHDITSSPAAKNAPESKPWSLTGLLSFLNPFAPRLRLDAAPVSAAARNLADRGHQMQQELDSNMNTQEDALPESVSSSVPPPPSTAPLPQPQQEEQPQPPPQPETQTQPEPQGRLSDFALAAFVPVTLLQNITFDDPRQNLITMINFLEHKLLQNPTSEPRLNEVELTGLLALLNNSVEKRPAEPKSEPFRFRFESSLFPTTAPTVDVTTPGTAPKAPRLLDKNPNGQYYWRGIGSAKVRPRTRYYSPGFGPSKPAPPQIKIIVEKTETDLKRRRIGEDAATSSSQSVPSFMSIPGASSALRAYGTVTPSTSLPSTSTSASPSASRTILSAKPTTPARPSPLRQAWGNLSDSSSSEVRTGPTRAAATLTALLKGNTPEPKPYENPYQAKSCLPPRPIKKQPLRQAKSAATKTATTPKPAAQQPAKERPLSAQAIIEATVPKGSKRSRPPSDLPKRTPVTTVPTAVAIATPPPALSEGSEHPFPNVATVAPSISKAKRPATAVEDASEDATPPSPPKKQRTNGAPAPANAQTRSAPVPVTVEEVDDVDMPVAQPSSSPRSIESTPSTLAASLSGPAAPSLAAAAIARTPFGSTKSTVPRVSSKLRYSYHADAEEKEKETGKEREREKEKSKEQDNDKETKKEKGKEREREKEKSKEQDKDKETKKEKGKEREREPGQEPEDEVDKLIRQALEDAQRQMEMDRVSRLTPAFGSTGKASTSSPTVPALRSSATNASGSSANPAPSSSRKTTLASSVAPAPLKTAATPLGEPFVLSKKKRPKRFGSIANSLAVLEAKLPNYDFENISSPGTGPSTLTRRARRAALTVPTSSLLVFDFAATGSDRRTAAIAPPEKPAEQPAMPLATKQPAKLADTKQLAKPVDTRQAAKPAQSWRCSLCSLINSASAVDCEVCDAPKPGRPTAPKVVSFDWSAAGLKLPTQSGDTWTCSVCMLKNKGSATKCTTCDAPR